MSRTDVEFRSGDATCAAWSYRPDGHADDDRRPVIVMAHGLGGVKEMRLDAYAERFTAAGYCCLVFDYRHFGTSAGEPRQLIDIGRQLEDWRAAVAHARTLPGVDPEQVVLWGTSFSGGHVLEVAARDPRVAAVVSQGPFTSGPASALALHPVTSIKLAPSVLRDLVARRRGQQPVTVAVAGPPRSAALMTAPDALPGYGTLLDQAPSGRNAAAARFALQIIGYRPGRRARKVGCPLFVALCAEDSVAPPRASRRHLRKAPRLELTTYRHGHFEIYVGEPFEEVVEDQLEFLARHLPATA